MDNSIDINNIKNRRKTDRKKKKTGLKYYTYNKHPLTVLEARFIDEYVASGNGRQSVLNAGYKTKAPGQYCTTLLNKVYIREEIEHRLEELKSAKIADATEILEYFSSVMRGEVKDQFGLEASLGERTKAAQELAKRQIDIPGKLNGKDTAEVKITLDWTR